MGKSVPCQLPNQIFCPLHSVAKQIFELGKWEKDKVLSWETTFYHFRTPYLVSGCWTIPKNLEARRCIAFFSNSLFLDMPRAPKMKRCWHSTTKKFYTSRNNSVRRMKMTSQSYSIFKNFMMMKGWTFWNGGRKKDLLMKSRFGTRDRGRPLEVRPWHEQSGGWCTIVKLSRCLPFLTLPPRLTQGMDRWNLPQLVLHWEIWRLMVSGICNIHRHINSIPKRGLKSLTILTAVARQLGRSATLCRQPLQSFASHTSGAPFWWNFNLYFLLSTLLLWFGLLWDRLINCELEEVLSLFVYIFELTWTTWSSACSVEATLEACYFVLAAVAAICWLGCLASGTPQFFR